MAWPPYVRATFARRCSADILGAVREAADKKAAAERYAKLHAAGTHHELRLPHERMGTDAAGKGKTDQAKSDMARLQEIRKKREADAKARLAREEGESEPPLGTTQEGSRPSRRGKARGRGEATGPIGRQKVGLGNSCQLYIAAIV